MHEIMFLIWFFTRSLNGENKEFLEEKVLYSAQQPLFLPHGLKVCPRMPTATETDGRARRASRHGCPIDIL